MIKPNLSLYLILDPDMCLHHHPLDVLAQALKGGVSLVQFRHKNTTRDASATLAAQSQQLCKKYNIPFLVNDDPLLALDTNADGCHLGQNDTKPEIARHILGPHALIGRTVRSSQELIALSREVKENLCHYIGIGAVFKSTSKNHQNHHFLGIKGLQNLVRKAHSLFSPSFPLCAISGINPLNASEVLSTSISGIAIISAICSSPNPLLATSNLLSIVHQKRTHPS